MAKKEISIILRARNAMAAGIASASASLKSFGQSAMRIGKWFAAGFLAAGTAVAGFAAKALSAYSVQEKAVVSLTSAINAFGENSKAVVPELLAVASAIQDETGAADEATVATMARLKLLGVLTPALGDAARAVLALKSVGMEEAAASKAVAMAMQGQYTMLNRYVPALRNATTEQEKAQIVNDLITNGYQQQRDILGTVGGSWAALKGRIGDAWEEIGRAISQNGLLTSALQRAGDAVKDFTARVAEWASGGEMARMIYGVRVFAEEAGASFKEIGLRASIVWQSIADAAKNAGDYIGGVVGNFVAVWVQDLKYLADYAVAVWDKIKNPASDFKAPSAEGVKAAYSGLFDAATGQSAAFVDNTTAMYAELDALAESHNAKLAKLEADHLAEMQRTADKGVEAEKKAMERIEIAAEKHVDAMAGIVAQGVVDGAQADLASAKATEAEAKASAVKAEEEASTARQMFFSKDARRAAKEKARIEAKEARQMERALEQGRKGLTGASITRAQQADAARIKSLEETERAKFAEQDRIARESALAEATEAIKTNTGNIATNTADLADKMDEIAQMAP